MSSYWFVSCSFAVAGSRIKDCITLPATIIEQVKQHKSSFVAPGNQNLQPAPPIECPRSIYPKIRKKGADKKTPLFSKLKNYYLDNPYSKQSLDKKDIVMDGYLRRAGKQQTHRIFFHIEKQAAGIAARRHV